MAAGFLQQAISNSGTLDLSGSRAIQGVWFAVTNEGQISETLFNQPDMRVRYGFFALGNNSDPAFLNAGLYWEAPVWWNYLLNRWTPQPLAQGDPGGTHAITSVSFTFADHLRFACAPGVGGMLVIQVLD